MTTLKTQKIAPSLADALEWLETAQLGKTEERDLRSAVETSCRWFKKSPAEVPADPAALRRLFRQVPAGAVGVTKKRRANVKWGLGRLLVLGGVAKSAVRNAPATPAWVCLINTICDPYGRVLLSRFARFCSAHVVEAENVSDAVAGEFLEWLEQEFRVGKPQRVHRETVRLWNRMAGCNPLWPKQVLTLPNYSPKYILAWDVFPASLAEDVERYLSKQATVDVFDLSSPICGLKPSSVDTYRDRLRRFASCLVLSGADPRQLRSLSDLVQLQAVEKGLRFLAQQRGRKALASVVATVLANVARHHLARPEHEVEVIFRYAARLRGKKRGLCPKVRERLAPLKHEGNLARLFLLPTGLIRGLMRKPCPTARDAQQFQLALALLLLTVCPLRVGSLCSLRIDRHFNWSGGSMKGNLIIEFAEGELKNSEPAAFPVPQEVANLVRTYWTRFRPLQAPGSSPFIFCGRNPERPRAKGGLTTLLTRLVFQRLGLHVNPHLYRHIVHLVVLRKFPGAYAMVARVLTHRSITTTVQNYSHFDGEIAMQAYQQLVEGIRGNSENKGERDLRVVAYSLDREEAGYVSR